ncbi:MAG TPA: site-2 protease family protein [Terriglobales bacterium]|jgi:membrane-associated protease RseP (regulator of RpoE activity)|nr:site-2 protease family protein [Terriglobales bacterium]
MSEPLSPTPSTYELPAPVEVFVVPRPRRRYWLHALLLLATVFTTLVVGARMEYNFLQNQPLLAAGNEYLPFFQLGWVLQNPTRLLLGIPFAGALLVILLAHEMGHYYYCLKYGVYATLPFFIPAPTLIGTMGAFILIRSPIRTRSDLFDIGIAGPIAGFVLSVVALLCAIFLSRPIAPGMPASDILLGYPLIFHFAHWLGPYSRVPLDHMHLHPVAIAAWVGMFATALNLLPGGQLDGGHIVFSLWPKAHRWVSALSLVGLILLGYFGQWPGWWVWAVLLFLSGLRHPRVSPWPGLDRKRKLLAVFALIMLVLTIVPAPFRLAGVAWTGH